MSADRKKNPTTDQGEFAEMQDEIVHIETDLPPKLSSLRQKLHQKAKQEKRSRFTSETAPCDSPRLRSSGKPDAGNPHVRFDEGEGPQKPLPTLPLRVWLRLCRAGVFTPWRETQAGFATPRMTGLLNETCPEFRKNSIPKASHAAGVLFHNGTLHGGLSDRF